LNENLGEIPLSIEEKTKYGYGFDLNKYKTDYNI
jgi:hypothetical protein